jgi:sigma-B regulation protein RsbU (phosphoserine phosphatase)
MLYAVIDVARNEINLARAGHELPLFVRHQSRPDAIGVDFVGSEGMALGLAPDDVFSAVLADHAEPFVPGDSIVLYTDGITEAPNEEGKEFSGARLADAARNLRHRSAREINEGILEHVLQFTGQAPQRDDFTLLTVKRQVVT